MGTSNSAVTQEPEYGEEDEESKRQAEWIRKDKEERIERQRIEIEEQIAKLREGSPTLLKKNRSSKEAGKEPKKKARKGDEDDSEDEDSGHKLVLRSLSLLSEQWDGGPPPGIATLTHLSTLCLAHNEFTRFDPAICENLAGSLTQLSVQGNKFTDLDCISAFTELRRLDISFNRLTRLPDLSRMRRLKRLEGAYNSFEELPEDCWPRLTRLKQLNLANNEINNLPTTFFLLPSHNDKRKKQVMEKQKKSKKKARGMVKLKALNLYNNHLNVLLGEPTGKKGKKKEKVKRKKREEEETNRKRKNTMKKRKRVIYKDLTSLSLGNNQLKSFNEAIAFPLTYWADLSYNELTSEEFWGGGILSCTSLTFLVGFSNLLTSIPSNIDALSHLLTLNLNDNAIIFIPKVSYSVSPTYIPSHVFFFFLSLSFLSLSLLSSLSKIGIG